MDDAACFKVLKKRTNDGKLGRHRVRLAAFVDSEVIAVVDDVRGRYFCWVNISYELEKLSYRTCVGRAPLPRPICR